MEDLNATRSDVVGQDGTSHHRENSLSSLKDLDNPPIDYGTATVDRTAAGLDHLIAFSTTPLAHDSWEGGTLSVGECAVCLDQNVMVTARSCCSKHVCKGCMMEVVRLSVIEGRVHIKCPISECDETLKDREIYQLIEHDAGLKSKYDRFKVDQEKDGDKKTCPRCCLITEHRIPRKFRLKESDVKLKCTYCELEWCFKCHAPWHEGMTCKAFMAGDKEFKRYVKKRQEDQLTPNCQKCPLCRVYIERSSGCPHMTCGRCGTEFCYFCGEVFVPLVSEFLHQSEYSFVGCKYRYRGSTLERIVVRGTYAIAAFSFLVGYPILFVGGVALVATACLIGLPVFVAYKMYRICRRYRSDP